ncbi:Toluene efflux pump membrane transporter TtgB [Stieleria neptunia]|uniref:Toluene efflux pump membrane transporter TtgB n=1 Tax=Stieleria neptunia TaxID=2527979 RepID=A0A518HKL9_9BACT|nr:efflux RND transporter permease subunit [Stieleria neptunia]QDV41391.1 Toluene efflux pump membrane transporter TtgB [Stieleria neptunia]
MALIEAFVKNPVKVSVAVLLVSLFGVVALTRMPMQLTPEVQIPTITIETTWPGASPQEVEQEITMEQEEQLKSVEGVTKMTSESADSKGTITLEFLVGTNMEEALLKVNSRLQQVPEYPEDSDEPVITTANASDRPIAWFILSTRRPTDEQFQAFEARHPELVEKLAPARHAHNVGLVMLRLRLLAQEHPEVKELLPPDDLDVTKLRRFAEDEIEARFERVPGVSQSNVIGGLEDELQVIVDPEKLAARQLTLADVRNVLQGQNKDTSAGDFWEGKRRWVVRAMGQFRSPEQVEQQLLSVTAGAPVFVRDVAKVELGYKKPDGLVRRFGESSIAINCLRETDANVLDVMEGLRAANQDIDENILEPRGLQLTQVYDETEYIYSSIELVQQNIFIGGALTMIVLMLFLHLGVRTIVTIPLIVASSLAAAYLSPLFFLICIAIILVAGFWFARGALVVALAIPTSIIASFLVLGVLGRSLNVISLAGLAFAVGMLVDNAVVVLENVYRHFKSGESAVTAAVRGTQEVWGAIAASTITTIAVFLPIVFVQEEAGQLFRDIALAISAAVALSLVISMSVIPTAASRLFQSQPDRDAPSGQTPPPQNTNRITQFILWPVNAFGETFVRGTVGFNDWIQRGTLRRLGVAAALVLMALGISWSFWPKVEYLPTGNRNLVFGILLPPPGYNLDQLTAAGKTVETALRPYWDVDPESAEAAALDFPAIGDFFFVARGRQVFMGIRAYDGQRAGELVPLVQQVGASMPGTFAVAKQSSLFEQGLTAGRTIEIEITGPDLIKLVALGGQTIGKVKQIMPTAQARPIPSLDLSSPEIHITPKLVQAAEMGVSSRDLGFSANCLIDGAYAGDYYLDGKKIDLTIVGELEYADTTQEIQALPIATPGGQLIPLAALADVDLASGPEQVNHRERVRAITIEVSPPPEVALEDAMAQIKREIVDPLTESGQLGGGYQVNLAGTADKLSKMQTTFLGQWSGWNLDSLLSVLTSQFVLVILITYLLMAALFESWLYPLVIILTVPLGAVGGILGLNLLNVYLSMTGQLTQQLDILTMLGFVILVGTVVNNPILIVHQSLNHMREDGMSPRGAILESVRTRIRPIFMTTLTTVLGLFPLVLFPGAGSELYRGLGSVVLGGLLVSTIFTLVLVPTLFSLLLEAKAGLTRQLFGNRAGTTSQSAALPSQRRTVQLVQPGEPTTQDADSSCDRPTDDRVHQPASSTPASQDDR